MISSFTSVSARFSPACELPFAPTTSSRLLGIDRPTARALLALPISLAFEPISNKAINLWAKQAVEHSTNGNNPNGDAQGFFGRVEIHKLSQISDGLPACNAGFLATNLNCLSYSFTYRF
jgi:hypothetical protein